MTIPLIIIGSSIVLGGFYLTKNIKQTAILVKEKQISRRDAVEKNPLIFPGHLAHKNVRKYYLEKNFDNMEIFKQDLEKENIDVNLYNDFDKEKLRSSPIIKGLTDVILVITGIMIAILLTYRNKKAHEV